MNNNVIDAIIEIPMGSKNKYEICANGKIKLDRVLYSSMTYPAEYGYIDKTLSPDGDPLDILVITSGATFPGCVVEAKVLGHLAAIDDGDNDYKVIAVNNVDPRYNHINSLYDLGEHTLREIRNFFENYKTLQDVVVQVKDYHDAPETVELIRESRKAYRESKK